MTPIYQQVMAANALRDRGNPQQQPASAYPPVQQLRNQSDIGLLGIMSGYKPLQQAGAFLSSDAASSIKAMEANKIESDKQHALEKYWEQQNEVAKQKADDTATYQQGRLEVDRERNRLLAEQKQGVRDERNLARLSAAMEKSGTIPVRTMIGNIHNDLADQGTTRGENGQWNIQNNVEGIGGMDNVSLYTTMTGSEKAKKLAADTESLRGYMRKILSGTAVSSQEMKAEARRWMMTPMNTDKDFLNALDNLDQSSRNQVGGIFSGAPEVVPQYLQNQTRFKGSIYGFDPEDYGIPEPTQVNPVQPDATGMQPGMVNSYTDLSTGQSPSTVVYDTGR